MSHESRDSSASPDSHESCFSHAKQLLFSCVSPKVTVCNAVSFHMSCVKWDRSLGHAEQLLFFCACVLCKLKSDCLWCCHMWYVKYLGSLGHAEQLLFSCLCSYVICHMTWHHDKQVQGHGAKPWGTGYMGTWFQGRKTCWFRQQSCPCTFESWGENLGTWAHGYV